MNGKRVMSCVIPVVQTDKNTVKTIKGLDKVDSLRPVQQAFLAEGAKLCGYCTPGMIMTAAALLEKNPNPTNKGITAAMNTKICRCGQTVLRFKGPSSHFTDTNLNLL
jgi:aerobic-type carbon monoxide dehydrogenase small subunit (CoxS/CutS family)